MGTTFILKTATINDSKNPTPQQIAENVEHLPLLPRDNFLIVERTDSETQGISASYLQAGLQDRVVYKGLFRIEYRDGLAGRHYVGFVEAGALVIEVFASYLNDDDLWRELVLWRDISNQFEDLRATLPPEELTALISPDSQPGKSTKEKRKCDKEFWHQFEEEQGPFPPFFSA